MSDWTRKSDLAEIAKAIKNARSQGEREYYEQIGYRIINETAPIQSLRDELARAVRAGDYPKVDRIVKHIQYIRAEETGGTSWGNAKGNRTRLN